MNTYNCGECRHFHYESISGMGICEVPDMMVIETSCDSRACKYFEDK